MAPRRDHQVAVVVWVTVEHHQRERPRVEHQPAAALTRAERAEAEDTFAPGLPRDAQVGSAPGRPQSQRSAHGGLRPERAYAERAWASCSAPLRPARSSLPVRKKGTRLASTATMSPVRGLR